MFSSKSNYFGGSGGDIVTAILLGEVSGLDLTDNIDGSSLAVERSGGGALNRVNSTGSSRRNSTLGGGRVHGRQMGNGRLSVACVLGPQGDDDSELNPQQQQLKKRREKEKMDKRINEMIIGDFY